jgi:hypothetical protein
MMSSIALRFTGWVLVLGGVLSLVATGDVAVALGTPGPMPANGASDAAAMMFWHQLAFIRMFGTAAIGCGAVCLWGRRHLAASQHVSLFKVLAGVLAFMCWIAAGQQTAIWGGNAGWIIVALIGLSALACAAALALNRRSQPA